MIDIKVKICSLGLPIDLINKKRKIHIRIDLNKNYYIVGQFFSNGDKIWKKGYNVYLSDIDEQILEKCYPKDLLKRLKWYLYK